MEMSNLQLTLAIRRLEAAVGGAASPERANAQGPVVGQTANGARGCHSNAGAIPMQSPL